MGLRQHYSRFLADGRQRDVLTTRRTYPSRARGLEIACPRGIRWSMWRPTLSLVALCSTHVGVTFEGGEYLCRGAAVHDPIESSTPVRQPDVEPSNKLQLVAFSELLLGALRLRGTKDCNDLSWL